MSSLLDPTAAAADPVQEAALWRHWREQGDTQARETLIRLHTPYARILAAKLYAGRYHDEVEFDDYFQFACVGLLESVDRYDPQYGARFRTFASARIQGAILNGLEKLTERQQQIALRKRLLQERTESLRGADNDAPSLDQLAAPEQLARLAEIGIGLALGYLLGDSGMLHSNADSLDTTPMYVRLELRQLQQAIRDLVEGLPERERKLIHSHYFQQVPFEQMAQEMGLTKGRISQIHRQALGMLRELARKRKPSDHAW